MVTATMNTSVSSPDSSEDRKNRKPSQQRSEGASIPVPSTLKSKNPAGESARKESKLGKDKDKDNSHEKSTSNSNSKKPLPKLRRIRRPVTDGRGDDSDDGTGDGYDRVDYNKRLEAMNIAEGGQTDGAETEASVRTSAGGKVREKEVVLPKPIQKVVIKKGTSSTSGQGEDGAGSRRTHDADEDVGADPSGLVEDRGRDGERGVEVGEEGREGEENGGEVEDKEHGVEEEEGEGADRIQGGDEGEEDEGADDEEEEEEDPEKIYIKVNLSSRQRIPLVPF